MTGVLASCSPGRDTEAADATPTFRRVSDEVLHPTEPIAQVADLQAPAEPGKPWHIVGSIVDPDSGVSRAAVWSTAEPPRWEVDEIKPVDGDVSEAIEAVTPFDGSLLAAGRVGDGADSDAAVWRRRDGEWERITPPEMAGPHGQLGLHIAVSEGGVLVAGGETAWGDVRPRMWFSTDGETWKSVDGGAGGPLDSTGEESVSAVTGFGPGFVAVGRRDVEGNQDGVVWLSPDGKTWEAVDAPAFGGDGRQAAESVTNVAGTLVAGGYVPGANGQGVPAVWTSTDGRTWNGPLQLELHTTQARSTEDLSVSSLTVNNGTQLQAAGGSDPMPHMWTSDDFGATWSRLPNPADNGAELFKDGVGLIDFVGTPELALALSEEPTVLQLGRNRWEDATGDEFPKGGDRPNATSVVVNDDGTLLAGGFSYNAPTSDGRERFSGRVWVGNGNDITVVEGTDEQPDLDAGHVTDIAEFKGGYVAVGVEDFAIAGTRPTFFDRNPDGLLWTSPDGTAWTRQAAAVPRTPDELLRLIPSSFPTDQATAAMAEIERNSPPITHAPGGGFGTQTLQAVEGIGDGYIAVGRSYGDHDGDPNIESEYDIDPIVVISPDGVAIADGGIPGFSGPGVQRLEDVCIGEDGSAIAVGVTGSGQDLDVVVFKRTPDGVWTQGATADGSFGGPGGQRAAACAAGKDGYLIVGTDDARGNVDARVWSSTDGIAWTQMEAGSLGGAGNQTATAASAVPDGGWVVAGTDSGAGDTDVALWRILDDGQVRRRDRDEPSLAGPGDQRVTSIVATDKRTIIVGNDRMGVAIWETTRLER